MTILRAQVESNEQGLCCCGQRATSELSYAEEMDQRQDASSPSPPSSPPTDGSYQTPVMESVVPLIPVPESVQLPSPTSSEEEQQLQPNQYNCYVSKHDWNYISLCLIPHL